MRIAGRNLFHTRKRTVTAEVRGLNDGHEKQILCLRAGLFIAFTQYNTPHAFALRLMAIGNDDSTVFLSAAS